MHAPTETKYFVCCHRRQGQDITESYINLTSVFPSIAFNMRTGPWQPTNIEGGQNLIRNCGSPPNFKLAVTLGSRAANGVLPAGLNGSAGIFLAAAPAESAFNGHPPYPPDHTPWSTSAPLSSLVVNSSTWINMAWTLAFNSGRTAGVRACGNVFVLCLYCACGCAHTPWRTEWTAGRAIALALHVRRRALRG
jgi:hypothetical protein